MPLIVDFASEVTSGTAPLSFFWNFGDGSTSNQQNPVYVLTIPGTYQVSMTATDADTELLSTLGVTTESGGSVENIPELYCT